MSEDVVERRQGRRLLIILLIGLACVDICMEVMLIKGFIKSEAFFGGLMIGQLALVGVMAGSMGRAWVSSLLLASLLAICVTVTLLSVSNFPNWVLADDFIDPCLLIVGSTPPIVFCCSLPFLITRAITGFRLSEQPATVGRSITMEDFFLTTGVCAAMLVTVPAAFNATNESSDGIVESMATAGLVVFGVSLMAVLPSTITYFVLKRPAVRLLALAGICIGAPLLLLGVLSLSGLLKLSGTTFVEEFGAPLVTATGCFALSLVVLRAAGFAWLRDHKAMETAVVDPLADVDQPVTTNITRWRNRVASVVMVMVSAGFVLFCKNLERHRQAIAERVTAISADWSTQAGGLRCFEKFVVWGITAPRTARLEDLEFLLQSQNLGAIELAGTGITDAVLAKIGSLNDLQTIDLSHTNIGDSGLRALHAAKDLSSINLAYTKVTVAGLQTFLTNKEHVRMLNLGGLGLTDSELSKLPVSSIPHLTLSHNPLTASALPYLRHAYTLDLSHTQIVGADLTQLIAENLILDYTPTTDQQIKTRFESKRELGGLSLRGTQVTDASLPLFTNLYYLAVGDSPITAAGLAQSGIAATDPASAIPPSGMPTTGSATKLALNDKHFDGSLFATRKWYVAHLDLRNSSISDRDIGQLANVVGITILDLRGCDISDASLPFLSSLSLSTIDLTGTKVTGKAAWQFLENIAVTISPSQCSEEVLQNSRNNSRWSVGDLLDEPLSNE